MPVLEWDDSFKLGVTQFDGHHKYLFGRLSQLFNDFMFGASHEELEVVLDQLIDFARFHFSAEECWMEVHGYPRLQQHHNEHEAVIHRVLEIQEDYHHGKTKLYLDVLPFLKDWMLNHVLTIDTDYGRFAKGVPSEGV